MNNVYALGRISACGARLSARAGFLGLRERLVARTSRRLSALCALLLVLPAGASTLNPSGDLDTGFDADGKAQFNFGTVTVASFSRAVIAQSGGKVVVGGGSNNGLFKDYVIQRINPDGTVDTSFGTSGGFTTTDMGFDDQINAMAVNSTGTRFCGGGISNAFFGVACYTANGLLDTSWNTDGVDLATPPGYSVGRIEGMAFDRDDNLIVVGWSNSTNLRDWAIRRYKPDGTPDPNFGTNSWVIIDWGANNNLDRAFDVAVLQGATHSADKLVIVGSSQNNAGAIAILNSSGQIDTTSNGLTGTSGKFTSSLAGLTQYRGVGIEQSGPTKYIVVTGQGPTSGFAVARFSLADGSSTSKSGLGSSTNDVGFRVKIGASDTVYASGTINAGSDSDFRVVHLSADLATTLWAGQTQFGGTNDFAQDLVVDPTTDKVTAVGGGSGGLNSITVARYNTDGTADTSFSGDGKYEANVTGGTADTSNALAVQSDGKVIVAGTTNNSAGDYDLLVTRINTDGTRDTAGWASATSGWDTRGFAAGSAEQVNPGGVAIDSNGKAVVVGTTSTGYFAVRYNTNGTLDTGFDTDGIVLNNWGTNSEGKVVAIDASNNVIVGGDISLNGDFKFSRLAASNGAVDATFGTSGTASVDISAGKSDVLKAIAIDPSGKIVAGGACVNGAGFFKMCMARLNTNGSLDTSFNGTGKVFLSSLSGNDTFDIRSLQLLPDLDTANATDYKIVVGGQYVQSSPSQAMWLVARFNMDGSLDTTFNTTGYKTFPAGPSTNIGSANSVALQYDEKIMVFGETSPIDPLNPGFYLNRQITVARLNWDGSLDTTYGTNGFTYATQGSDPGEAYQGYVYPQSNATLKGRALATNFIIASDFALTRYREDPAPISGASAPDLDVASDTGRSNADNITKDTTPTFTGTCSQGETVYLLVNGSNTQPRTRQICGAAGTYALTPTLSGIPRTTYSITTQSQSGIGDSAASSALSVTVDAEINPAIAISSPTAGSNVLPHPIVSGTSEGVADVVVTTSGTGSGCASPNLADASGNWTCASTFEQGAHTISVVQTDIAGNVSGPTTRSFNVKLPTSTAIAADVNPSRFGQSVTFTATVTPTGSYTINTPLTGTALRFQIDGVDAATRTLSVAGVATFSTSTLSVGTHTVSAIYDENANWLGSSAALSPNQTVLKADTTTAVAASVNPSVFGQNVSFTATVAAVSPGGGTPAGTVNFTVDGGAPVAVSLNGSAQAVFSTAALSVGNHSLAVDYLGNTNYNGSSTTLTGGQTVNKASSALALTASPNPSTRGQNVTFTATLSALAPGAGTPTGTVTFTIDGNAAGTQTLAGAVATLASSTLSTGAHTVTASYSGDGNFLISSGTLAGGQQVNKANSSTAVASSLNPSQYGQSVTFTATVTASAPTTDTPTGSVDFVIDGGAPQSGALDATGKATFTTSTLSGGNHTVVANYGGDANLKTSSASLAPVQNVQPLSTTTAVNSSVNPSVFGQSVTFTAAVTVTAPGTGTPSGNANFSIDGGAPQAQPLDASGHATLSSATLAVGTHTVAVTYAGDSNFSASNSTLTPVQTVNKSATQTTLTSSANPAPQGQTLTFTATVTGAPPSTGTPTGTVDLFLDGGAVPFASKPLAAGSAAFNTSALTAGSHTLSATYNGDTNFATSSGALTPDQVVFTQDFGDAPAPYPTLLADDGARHRIGGPHLGAIVDGEPDGQPSANADGDDNNGTPSDEDGVTFTTALIAGHNATVTVVASADAKLDAWIDFNANGSWADAGEQIFVSTPVVAGSNALSFAVPANTPPQAVVYARFRLSSAGGLGFNGFAPDGEVEDYKITTSPVIDLVVDESEAADPVVAGSGIGNLVHTVTVTNNGPSIASGVTLGETLVLPAGVTLTGATPSQGAFSASSWNVGSLAVGAKATLTLTMSAGAAAAPGNNVVCGTATLSAANEPLFNTGDDTDTECTSIVRQADLAVAQTESIDPVIAGSGTSNLHYTLTVQNNGPSNASGVLVADALTLPSGVTFVSATPSQGSYAGAAWTVGALPAGASATLDIALTAASNAASGTDVICAAASVTSANEALINLANDSLTTCTSVARQIDLHVTASDAPDPVSAGSGTGNLTHTITVANVGPSDASGVVLSDVLTLPPGASVVSSTPSVGTFAGTTWTLGSLAKGSNATLTVLITVDASTADAATVCDTASVTTANETLNNTADDSATECTTVAHTADLSITKTANANPPQAGANLIYTIAVHNAGPGNVTGVKVTDNLPAAVTFVQTIGCQEDANAGGGIPSCTLGTIASGADKAFTVEVSIKPQPPSSITNTASVSGNESDPNPANNQSSVLTTLDTTAPTVLAIETVGQTADIAVTDCATLRGTVNGIAVRFSEGMADPVGNTGAGDITNPNSYRLLQPQANATFATATCSDPLGGDISEPLSVTYDSASHTATLATGKQADGIHRLLVCSAVHDLAGNPLANGAQANTDVSVTYRVDSNNWLASGHFDRFQGCSGSPWSSSTPSALSFVAQDANASPLSGSVQNSDSNSGFDLTQCAAVVPGIDSIHVRSAVRIDASAGTLVSVTPQCKFYAQTACAGTPIAQGSAPVLLGQTSANFIRLDQLLPTVPAAAQSLACTFTAARAAGGAFGLYLDDVFVGSDDDIFKDGFE